VLTSVVDFIVIAIPVLHCYIFLPLLCVLRKKWPVPYGRSCTIRTSH